MSPSVSVISHKSATVASNGTHSLPVWSSLADTITTELTRRGPLHSPATAAFATHSLTVWSSLADAMTKGLTGLQDTLFTVPL